MSRICTICARGGSKGVKNKNLKPLLGKPLLAHTIYQAKISNMFDVVAVSSDSEEILEVAKQYGADITITRPIELASDVAAKLPGIKHCVKTVEQNRKQQFDIIVDLDVTSPLRSVEDIKQTIKLFEQQKEATNLITGSPSRRSPYFNLVELNKEGYAILSKPLDYKVKRRQDSPRCFDMNASIYIWRREVFFQSDILFQPTTILYEMPEERSVDIDSELDFEWVTFLANKRGELI